jgi:hypothetical protein
MRAAMHVYSEVPQAWIRVFFVSLAVLDPLVMVLAALGRREDIWLAADVTGCRRELDRELAVSA